jgi:hypothetical protein
MCVFFQRATMPLRDLFLRDRITVEYGAIAATLAVLVMLGTCGNVA